MRCIRCGTEFDEGIFCPTCGQKHEEADLRNNKEELAEDSKMLGRVSDSSMKQEENNDTKKDEDIFKRKRPIILSIPVILLVGFLHAE